MYPFYERLVKWSKEKASRNVCIHKGLFRPRSSSSSRISSATATATTGKAAKDWPQLNFVIYHSGYRWVAGPGGTAAAAWTSCSARAASTGSPISP